MLQDIGRSKILENIGDLPNYCKSLIQNAKIDKKLKSIDTAYNYIKKASDIALQVKSNKLINESFVEQEIIKMYKNNESDSLLSFINDKESNLGDELTAYIHLSLWEYNQSETSKSIALDLYTRLYKDFPKEIYKKYIDSLS